MIENSKYKNDGLSVPSQQEHEGSLPKINRGLLQLNSQLSDLLKNTISLYQFEERQNRAATASHLTASVLRKEAGFPSSAISSFIDVPTGKAIELFEVILYDLGARVEQGSLRSQALMPINIMSSLIKIEGLQSAVAELVDERTKEAVEQGGSYTPGFYLQKLLEQAS